MKNFEELHLFVKGMKGDFDNHGEDPQSFQKGINGRLYSKNGTISYSSIEGTKKIYENINIVKYLGFFPFKDELICFVKGMPELITDDIGTIEYQTQKRLVATSIDFEIPYGSSSAVVDINSNVSEFLFEVPVFIPAENPFNFSNNVSCTQDEISEIDFSEYFSENLDFENLNICNVNLDLNDFENNKDFIDVIISLKKDDNGLVYDKVIWAGFQNWPLDGKIIAQGVYENEYYKRVYYTDFVNVFRSLNLKDPNIQYRNESEFGTFQNTALLQPLIDSINNTGEIRSSTCYYTYRLITANGQVSAFAPFSKDLKILFENNPVAYRGGDVSEQTDKSVRLKINVLNHTKFAEIEAVAIEYEAENVPTAIRSLGVKPTSAIVYFDHFGTELEFANSITISDLTERKNNWKYCSDILAVRNKLIVAGLRNEPVPTALQSVSEDFALHGWDENGDTHNCLINPMPWKYRYIDPSNTTPLYFVKQKLYNSINVFGNFSVSLKNTTTGETMSISFNSNELVYVNHVQNIFNWVNTIQGSSEFIAKFPNLSIIYQANKMCFKPVSALTETDMTIYTFEYSTTQVFEDISKDILFRTITVNTSKLVYGAVSLGFNSGNGIRITYQTELEELLTKATAAHQPGEKLLDFKEPNLEKSFVKGEIYRYGLQCFDNSGNELFVIPLGDLMIPNHGETKKYLNDAGDIVIESDFYKNSKVVGNGLFGEKIKLRVEVRLSCDVQKVVSMYQLVHVERTEENRTILAQGIAAPLERTQRYFHFEYIEFPTQVTDKWNLPYYGGPTYDGAGLAAYDNFGEENQDSGYERSDKRIITNRRMFYFDSPDVIHGQISSDRLSVGKVQVIGRLNTDHTRTAIRQTNGEVYPRFSRKIYESEVDHNSADYRPYFVNVSVFSNERKGDYREIPIYKSEFFNDGQIIAGYKFDSSFDVSNHALTLAVQPWFYSGYARMSKKCGGEQGARSELFNSGNASIGRSTVIIKTQEDVFSQSFIDQSPFYPDAEVRLGGGIPTFDTHGLFNIKLNNRESVFGGRTELAFSKNSWIPISSTIPVLQTTNGSQVFKVEGDTYISLFIRNKNYFSFIERGEKHMNNSGGCGKKKAEEKYAKDGAWAYAVVLETQVEPKLTHNEVFYKKTTAFNFDNIGEVINEAYFQNNSPKSYISKPFRFRDDPNLNNVIAASDPKLNGNFYDDWTNFRVNNFYEIDKDKGTVFNLGKDLDKVFAIQEHQTSEIIIDERTMINTSNGEIAIKEGDGNSISTHKVVSDFGTSIRRAVVEIMSSTDKISGFSFFDERRLEFVKSTAPLFLLNELHLSMKETFKNNPIVDTEGYYDDQYKETNIKLKTKNGTVYMISFNELFQVFNGWIEYDNDLYAVWNDEIYSPITKEVPYQATVRPDSSELHALNKGPILNLFNEQKTIKLGIIVNPEAQKVKIYPHWSGVINIDYPIKSIEIKTSLDQLRTVLGSHSRYKIREEIHSVPLKNKMDWDDLRGKWMYLEIEIESIDNKKIDIYSFVNFVRNSYL